MSTTLTSPELTRLYELQAVVADQIKQEEKRIKKEEARIITAQQEDRMLNYLKALGWEASKYVTTGGPFQPGRRLQIITHNQGSVPAGIARPNCGFVQSTLHPGCGVHNVLVAAMKEWETAQQEVAFRRMASNTTLDEIIEDHMEELNT